MAQGTPVVSTAELGTKSILTEGCGAFVVPESEDQFASAVARALQLPVDAPERAQLRAHAERWASHAMARRLLMFYERVAAQRNLRAPQMNTPPEGAAYGEMQSDLAVRGRGSLR
jgi:glycosyltransferase involved in cell wall biosynthesis